MESLNDRLRRVLKDAGLSPRVFGAVTKVHYTTIYGILSGKYTDKTCTPATVQLVTTALDKLEKLIVLGYVPFKNEVKHKERAELLASLFDRAELFAPLLQA